MLTIFPVHLEAFRQRLLSEGFRDVGLLQIWKRGQVFGYARLIRSDLEWHVRAFVDGTLESELEAPRTTIHHLLKPVYMSDGLLALLLKRHRIPFSSEVRGREWHDASRVR